MTDLDIFYPVNTFCSPLVFTFSSLYFLVCTIYGFKLFGILVHLAWPDIPYFDFPFKLREGFNVFVVTGNDMCIMWFKLLFHLNQLTVLIEHEIYFDGASGLLIEL